MPFIGSAQCTPRTRQVPFTPKTRQQRVAHRLNPSSPTRTDVSHFRLPADRTASVPIHGVHVNMRGMRRTVLLTGFLGLALLPAAAAAVSPDPSSESIPVAIAQPIAAVAAPLMPESSSSPRLSETGLLVLIGTGLMTLAAVVRKTTHIQ